MPGDGRTYGSTYVSFTGDIPGALRRASDPLAEELADKGLIILQRNCPVDSGELLESCYSVVVRTPNADRVVAMGATADHAAPVEFGHLRRDGTFQPPNPFVRRSMSELLRGRR